MLMRISGPDRNERAGGWTELHAEEAQHFLLFAKCYWTDQIKKDETSRVCSMHLKQEKNLKGLDHLEFRGVRGSLEMG
jgi:hypothetical protein